MARDPADIAQDQGRDGLTRSFDASKPYRGNGVHPPINGAKGRVAETAEEILELISAAQLLEKPAPKRAWFVDPYIPHKEVTLLAGDGGIGKSLIGLQLCGAAASGREWMGIATRSCTAVFVSCEDDKDELHYRIEKLQAHEPTAKLDRLYIIDRAGKNNVLAAPERDGVLRSTPLLHSVEVWVRRLKAELLVLDAAADLYGGEENNRAQVRTFIQLLRGIALRNDCAILLLSHPSVDGMKTGRYYSGSTALNNSVRSRLYFSAPSPSEGEADTDARILELMKSNRAQRGFKLCLRWKNGVFVPEGTGENVARKMEIGVAADEMFLKLLDERNSQKRHVSDRPGINFAPKVFEGHPAANGITRDQFRHAMERLFTASRISVEVVGPSSRQVRQIVRAA